MGPSPNGGEINIVNPCAKCRTAPCNPVIGTDQKVYRNEHCAQCAGAQAVANAVDRSICDTEVFKEIIEWVKQNPVVVVIAAIIALLLIRGR